jgi:hypothetical protein
MLWGQKAKTPDPHRAGRLPRGGPLDYNGQTAEGDTAVCRGHGVSAGWHMTPRGRKVRLWAGAGERRFMQKSDPGALALF